MLKKRKKKYTEKKIKKPVSTRRSVNSFSCVEADVKDSRCSPMLSMLSGPTWTSREAWFQNVSLPYLDHRRLGTKNSQCLWSGRQEQFEPVADEATVREAGLHRQSVSDNWKYWPKTYPHCLHPPSLCSTPKWKGISCTRHLITGWNTCPSTHNHLKPLFWRPTPW